MNALSASFSDESVYGALNPVKFLLPFGERKATISAAARTFGKIVYDKSRGRTRYEQQKGQKPTAFTPPTPPTFR